MKLTLSSKKILVFLLAFTILVSCKDIKELEPETGVDNLTPNTDLIDDIIVDMCVTTNIE